MEVEEEFTLFPQLEEDLRKLIWRYLLSGDSGRLLAFDANHNTVLPTKSLAQPCINREALAVFKVLFPLRLDVAGDLSSPLTLHPLKFLSKPREEWFTYQSPNDTMCGSVYINPDVDIFVLAPVLGFFCRWTSSVDSLCIRHMVEPYFLDEREVDPADDDDADYDEDDYDDDDDDDDDDGNSYNIIINDEDNNNNEDNTNVDPLEFCNMHQFFHKTATCVHLRHLSRVPTDYECAFTRYIIDGLSKRELLRRWSMRADVIYFNRKVIDDKDLMVEVPG
ncbi:hypothetical protein SCAR479_13255 [Seiridium cardinale]|uniref:Uncharacterized protein n=1 Tax=Seiridium cardinale TaxID=138064 RepID=A0ABR2X8U6_9PEZI